MEIMIENNERLVDIMYGGSLYGSKERTATEINSINAGKRAKQFIKASGGTGPNVSQQTTQMINTTGSLHQGQNSNYQGGGQN
jgi:hypothetical protein